MKSLFLTVTALAGLQASAASTYVLTLTNASKMPLSPGVVYVTEGQTSRARAGQMPAAGFVQLCQMGNASARAAELRMDPAVKSVTQTMGPVMPGQSVSVEIEVADVSTQSVQLETMYGKTKDACAVGGINSHGLQALKQHVTSAVTGKDNVLQTGTFADPAIPAGGSYLDLNTCTAADAVGCLRALATPAKGTIRAFTDYLPTVLMLLEAKYGAGEVSALQIPEGGAAQFELKLKH